MNKINSDIKYLFLIGFILLLAIIPVYGHHGNLLIDCGREAYYPVQILQGKILYKDIFNIYGPFAYMFNAFLFKIFTINLNVLYIAGIIGSFFIASLLYLIARIFLSRFLSFAISIFTISIGVLNLNLFNFIFPYSYAMLYAFIAFLASVFFILKYQQNPEKDLYLYLGSFFAGVCITSKYEFIPYLITILYVILKIKPLKFKQYYFTAFSLLFVPIFCFGILFLQGLSINDLISEFWVIKKMTQTQTLKYFYHMQGVYFNKHTFSVLLLNFIKTIIPLSLFLLGFKAKNRIFSIGLIAFALGLMIMFINPSSFIFLPILVLISALLSFKILSSNQRLFILILSCLAMEWKVFWGVATLNYGVFFISFLLISVLALLIEHFDKTNITVSQKLVGIYFIIISLIFAIQNLFSLTDKNYIIQTKRGKIYASRELAFSTQELIDYININTKKTDKIVIYPEGLLINFLTDRKSDNYYSSLIPLYVETLGEEKIIEHFKKDKPEYIIFNNLDTADYYFKNICNDYAFSFCNFVSQNYVQKKVVDKGFRYLIFRLIRVLK